MSNDVVRNPETHRFELVVDGHLAFVDFRETPQEIEYIRTFVPDELRGQGIAGKLVKAAIAYANASHLLIRPTCPVFAAYVRKTPELHTRLADGVREALGI